MEYYDEAGLIDPDMWLGDHICLQIVQLNVIISRNIAATMRESDEHAIRLV